MLAFWIDPRGNVIKAAITHIATIIKHPNKFGLTKQKIQQTYDKYDEKIGWEGKAREEIMVNVMKKGYIRIRERSAGWTIQLWKLNKKMNDYLWEWAMGILPKVYDKYGEVSVWELSRLGNKPSVSLSLQDLASGKSVKESKKQLNWIDEEDIDTISDLSESDCIDWKIEDKLDKYLNEK